jgi:hypothetical protein
MNRASRIRWSVGLVLSLLVLPAAAQDPAVDLPADAPADVPETPAGAPQVEVEVTPGTAETTTTYTPYGFPAPGTDVNSNLPSGSRPLSAGSASGDTFDLNQASPETLRGREGSDAILSRGRGGLPDTHTVKKGDTLWELSDEYYKNPYKWPEVWSYNPQIQNPHWIYPGDQVRMRPRGGTSQYDLMEGGGLDVGARVPSGTVFLRNQGYIGDPKNDTWGMVVGGLEDQELFSFGSHIYMILRPGVEVHKDQRLTLFRRVREPRKAPGARQPAGEIVKVIGTVKIDSFDKETRVARGKVTESLDLVERGASVGPVGRKFDIVAPVRSEVDVWATVLDSFYPRVFYGRYQVAFIDKGSEDGLIAGNRLFAIRRGDQWRKTKVITKRIGKRRMVVDVPEWVRHEPIPFEGEEEDFPEEVVGELRVIRTQKYTSLCVVIESKYEMEIGEKLVARKGY